MGECSQPVVGMRSCFDTAASEWHEKDWRAREWFVVNGAEVRVSKGGVLVPRVRMGVEAREQIRGPEGIEDAVITRVDHPLVKYAEAFSENFDLIAERKSCVYHLRELAKASVLAKFLVDGQADLDYAWYNLAQESKEETSLEIPQLWNQRCFSQVQVRDGKIMDAERGMDLGTRGVYGGVQFGLDKFDLGATTMQPGAGEAPYSLLFSAAARGAVMARGTVTPPSLMEPRGVDLNLDKFDLEAVPENEQATEVTTGRAFWESAKDQGIFKSLFNPHLSDRREDGELFVPPDGRQSYMEELYAMLSREQTVQEERKEHFLSQDFVAGSPSSLFPASWATAFGIEGTSCAESLQAVEPEQQVVDGILKSVAATFNKTSEDGTCFRIYRAGDLELRTLQAHDGKEVLGAAFAHGVLASEEAACGSAAEERIIKATAFVEAAEGEARRFFIVYETEGGHRIATEKLEDGSVAWQENPRNLQARSSAARVLFSTDECGAGLAVGELKSSLVAGCSAGARASQSERKRYVQGALARVQAVA